MSDTKEISVKDRVTVKKDGSSICVCEFSEALGMHVAALCDALRKTGVFGRD